MVTGLMRAGQGPQGPAGASEGLPARKPRPVGGVTARKAGLDSDFLSRFFSLDRPGYLHFLGPVPLPSGPWTVEAGDPSGMSRRSCVWPQWLREREEGASCLPGSQPTTLSEKVSADTGRLRAARNRFNLLMAPGVCLMGSVPIGP